MAIFLKLGDLVGDATQADHRGWMAIELLRFGISRRIETPAGSTWNRTPRHPMVRPVRLWKRHCPASPFLMAEATAGRSARPARIHFVSTGDPGRTFLEIALQGVLVCAYRFVGDAGGHPMDYVQLDFTVMEMRYTPYDSGNGPGSPMSAGYDLTAASPC